MRRLVFEAVESLIMAMGALRGNPARSVLTTLGIVIGIVAVVTTMTAANGLANSFAESVSVLGADVLYVSRTPWVMTGRFFQFRNRPPVGLDESLELAARLGPAAVVNPTASTNRPVRFRSNTADGIDVIGTTEKHVQVSSGVPDVGRFLTPFEVSANKHVVVIGSEVRERLFDQVDPINAELRIGRHDFRVVGVMEAQGSAGFFRGPNFDAQVFIPVTTFTRVFGGAHRNFDIAAKAPPGVPLDDFEYEVTGAMRSIRRLGPGVEDNFAINQMDNLVAAFNNVMGVVVGIGLAITGVSLFVGGVGVMNIMFVSVTERTREIGIRKAIGARRRSILLQFLCEAATICLVGGLIGLGLSFGTAELVNRFLLPASVSGIIVVLALGVSVAVGLVAGMVPAVRASRLRPIDALRYE
jgi:putative ABC transport system permease protein